MRKELGATSRLTESKRSTPRVRAERAAKTTQSKPLSTPKPSPHGFDFRAFSPLLEAAFRAAAHETARKHPNDELCGFALYSDDGAMTICPAFNSRRHLSTRIAESPDEIDYLTFSPAEWAYEAQGAPEPFAALCSALLEHVSNLRDRHFRSFQRDLAETAISTLERLRMSGFFHSIAKDPLAVVFQASPGDSVASAERRMIARLNSREIALQHARWTRTWGA